VTNIEQFRHFKGRPSSTVALQGKAMAGGIYVYGETSAQAIPKDAAKAATICGTKSGGDFSQIVRNGRFQPFSA